jgi:broad specificity phosphatase PhoE
MAIVDIIGFRHGETDLNKAGILQGAGVNIDLNENGEQQADELALIITELCDAYDGIHGLSSDLIRAFNTWKKVHNKFPEHLITKLKSFEVTQALRERNFGPLEGGSKDIFSSHEGYAAYRKLKTVLERQKFSIGPGIESDLDVVMRMRNEVNKVIELHKDNPGREVLLLSTHGNTWRTTLSAIFNNVDYPPLKNCEHVIVSVNQWQQMLVAE